MSVQFGRWNFDGTPPSGEFLERAASTLASLWTGWPVLLLRERSHHRLLPLPYHEGIESETQPIGRGPVWSSHGMAASTIAVN